MYHQFQSSEPKMRVPQKHRRIHRPLPTRRKIYVRPKTFSVDHVLKMQRRLLELKRERDLVYRRIREKYMELKQLQHDSDNINDDVLKLESDLSLSRRSSVSSNSSMDSMKTQYPDGFESDRDFESDRGLSDFSDVEYDDTVNPLDHMILNR